MSQENIKKLIEAALNDEKLKSKFEESLQKFNDSALSDEERYNVVKNELIPLAAQEGFEFTEEDYKAYTGNILSSYGQLSDENLDKFSGGKGSSTLSSLLGSVCSSYSRRLFSTGILRSCSNCTYSVAGICIHPFVK